MSIEFGLGVIAGFVAHGLLQYAMRNIPTAKSPAASAIAALDLTRQDHTNDIKNWHPVPTKPIDFFDGSAEVSIAQPESFAVAGPARSIPWSRRKKELEAASRTRRKRIEEFREED